MFGRPSIGNHLAPRWYYNGIQCFQLVAGALKVAITSAVLNVFKNVVFCFFLRDVDMF